MMVMVMIGGDSEDGGDVGVVMMEKASGDSDQWS